MSFMENYNLDVKTGESLEEKVDLFIRPYNNSMEVKNFMVFGEDERQVPKIIEDKDRIIEKWDFITDFIFNNKKEDFREACYHFNKKM